MYTVHMQMNATEFRRNMFQTLDRAIQGDAIEIGYKGSVVKLVTVSSGSKLARLKRRDTILVDDETLIKPDPKVAEILERRWQKYDK